MKYLSRKFLVVMLAVSVILSLCAVSVFAGQQAIGVGTVAGSEARLRSGTHVTSTVCATLPQGTNLSVLGKSGDWYRVNYNGTTGYIAESAVSYVTSADDLQATAKVVADSATVRSAASLSGSKLCLMETGAELDVIGFANGWYQIGLDGQTGYIRSDEITLTGTPEAAKAAASEAEAQAASQASSAKLQNATATITADAVNLRKSPAADAPIIVALNTGDIVTVQEALDGWYKIAYDIHIGYVSADFVAVSETAVVPTASDSALTSSTRIVAVGLVTTSGVRMRQQATTDSEVITTLSDGTAVSVLGESSGWYIVNYDDMDGFISGDYLNILTSTTDLSTYGMVKTGVLNMRDDADASGNLVATLSQGLYLKITGFENGWYLASYDSYTGYVSGDYITLSNTKPEPVTQTTSSSSSSSGSSGSKSLPSGKSAGIGSASSSEIVRYAAQFEGVPYVYGGASPSGFDCSGFVMYVFGHFGYSLPHGATSQLSYGTPVDKSNLQPGDIVFFHGTSSGDTDAASHVGIFVGGSTFIHASSGSAYSVTYSDLNSSYYSSHYLTARRLG